MDIKDVKNFWDKRPCNIRHSLKPIGSKEYFDEVEAKKLFVEPHILKFSNFKNYKNKNVLEIGCGIGTAAINFAKNGAKYTGVELSESSLELTKRRFKVYQQEGEFFLGDAEQLSSFLPIKKYDLIYSFGVIHHSPNPIKIINQIQKYMHEKSVLKIMIYAKNSWKNYMIEAGSDQPEAQFGCPIALTYSENEARKLLEQFNILEIEQTRIFPYKINEYKNNIYKKEPWFENMSADMFNILEKKLGWHMLITAKLKNI